jgi:hypothetical protein
LGANLRDKTERLVLILRPWFRRTPLMAQLKQAVDSGEIDARIRK